MNQVFVAAAVACVAVYAWRALAALVQEQFQL